MPTIADFTPLEIPEKAVKAPPVILSNAPEAILTLSPKFSVALSILVKSEETFSVPFIVTPTSIFSAIVPCFYSLSNLLKKTTQSRVLIIPVKD